MRLLKLGLISAVVIFLILTAIGSMFPSKVIVSRTANINVSADSMRKYIDDYSEWNNWMDGAKNSEMKVVAKDSAHAYFGTVIITLLDKQKYFWKHNWKSKTFAQVSSIRIIPSNAAECTVNWEFQQDVSWYPWAKLGSMMNDKIIGASLEKSLDNLKVLAEKN
jgi:hypothetical protein